MLSVKELYTVISHSRKLNMFSHKNIISQARNTINAVSKIKKIKNASCSSIKKTSLNNSISMTKTPSHIKYKNSNEDYQCARNFHLSNRSYHKISNKFKENFHPLPLVHNLISVEDNLKSSDSPAIQLPEIPKIHIQKKPKPQTIYNKKYLLVHRVLELIL